MIHCGKAARGLLPNAVAFNAHPLPTAALAASAALDALAEMVAPVNAVLKDRPVLK